jgi:hypothetical protein
MPMEKIEHMFPAFERANIFGSATRGDRFIMDGFEFNVMGFDTGYVVASVCSLDDNKLLDR